MRPKRWDDASCPICMDSLVNAKDDLEEEMPIAAPDCGHVFHESCLLDWFTMQANQYVARMRDQGVRFRGESPTADDAPAECPSCRAECYADPETGKPILHRLFINFGEGHDSQPSQTQGSSQASPWRVKSLDSAGLTIARRAKGIGNEILTLTPENTQEDVGATILRAETLEKEANALSAKTSVGLKKYIGGLTVALNQFRSALEAHPLIPALRGEIAVLQEANNTQTRALRKMEWETIPIAVRKAVDAEKKKSDKAIKAVEAQRDVLQRNLEKEQVARVSYKRAMAEREADIEQRLKAAQKELKREQADRLVLQNQLTERTKLVKMYQTKADSSKALKAQISQLKLEVEALRERAKPIATIPSAESEKDEEGGAFDDSADLDGDLDAPFPLPFDIPIGKKRKSDADESLFVDMPDDLFDDKPAPAGRSHTARTFTFDVDEGRIRKGKGKERERERERVRDIGIESSKKEYEVESRKDREKKREGRPRAHSEKVADKENTSTRSKYFPPSDGVLVAASSPPASPHLSPKRARPNPFPLAKPKVDPSPEVIDLVSSSPNETPPRRVGFSRTTSLVDYLGVADDKGRMKKGVAVGTRVKKRWG